MGAAPAIGEPELVPAHHEEDAAPMAVGYGTSTGGDGVVTGTQHPGAIHLLSTDQLRTRTPAEATDQEKKIPLARHA